MNSLSWFLYWVDVITSLNVVFLMVAVASVFLAGVSSIGWCVSKADAVDTGNPTAWRTKADSWRQSWIKVFKISTPLGIILLVLVCLFPSKNTMYAIAASQVGERVVNSDAVQGITSDATKALQQWIKRQIDPPVKEK